MCAKLAGTCRARTLTFVEIRARVRRGYGVVVLNVNTSVLL
jgi:hypothetical protein